MLYSKEESRAYYKLNECRIKKYLKTYRRKNKQKAKQYGISYRLKNKERLSFLNKEYRSRPYIRHTSRIKRQKFYLENRERILERNAEWLKENPEKRHIYAMRQLIRYSKLHRLTVQQYRFALQFWSKTIKNFDNNMCKVCDSKENLMAHHIQPKQNFPELCLNFDNGVTLCKCCHMEVHHGY